MSEKSFKALYQYAYQRSPDQDAERPAHHPVIVVGAGPVGLAVAIDLAQRGVGVVLVDDNDRISEGSRAICFSKRALEVCDHLGVGQRMVDKGVQWSRGKVFFDEREVFAFDLLPEPGHKRPAFVNLQQYYVEAFLVERAGELDNLDVRWRNEVVALAADDERVEAEIDTPDGRYRLTCDWLIACDGARSPLRAMIGEDFVGQEFPDNFLIADIKMKAGFPTERWFWFDPPFNRGQSTLLHKQPDDVWRVDFQLGRDADVARERQPERVMARLKAMLGEDRDIALEWVSVYQFQCKRMPHFVHGRVIFAGDAAHQVSPFGARGANSGFEDAHNLAWKLAAIITGAAGPGLLDSYGFERQLAADDNIGHSTRATDFISPKSAMALTFRNATLRLAEHHPFARAFINSGRLSTPSLYAGSPLNTADVDHWQGPMDVGMAALDAPLRAPGGERRWLIDELGPGFTLLCVDDMPAAVPGDITVKTIGGDLIDEDGLFARRYGAIPGAAYLFRPDQYLCARWVRPSPDAVAAAWRTARGVAP